MQKYRLITAMDISGSMSTQKRLRSYDHFQKLVRGLSPEGFEEAYIKHFIKFTTIVIESTDKYNNNPQKFFEHGISGGTYISSGLHEILEVIEKTPEDILNIIVVYSDGDNWGEDNPKCIEAIRQISYTNSIFVFTNVTTSDYTPIIEEEIKNAHSEYTNPVFIAKTNERIVDESIGELLVGISISAKMMKGAL